MPLELLELGIGFVDYCVSDFDSADLVALAELVVVGAVDVVELFELDDLWWEISFENFERG